jgi:hypothetical protein
MDEQEATADSGASVLDRLEAKLNPPEVNAQEGQSDDATDQTQDNVETNDDGQQESQESQLTTTDLSKFLGIDESLIDVDDDGTVKLKTKIDGSEGTAKLADLLKSYQLEGHVNKKSMEVAEREKAVQQLMQQAESQAQARLQHVETLANVVAKELLKEYNNIDWNTLEISDPGQAALLRQKFQERQSQIRNVINEVEQNKAMQAQKSQEQHQQTLAAEARKLPEIIPEWKDDTTAAKEREEIRQWGLKSGFKPEELSQVAYASHVAVMRKAMLYDKLQQSKPAIENKVRTAPKLVKPGHAAMDGKAQVSKGLRQNIIKSGGKGDSVAEWLLATGKV